MLAAAMTAVGMTGCSSEEPMMASGEATVHLSAAINTDIKVQSRATVDEIKESTLIWISNSKGVVRKYDGLSELPAEGIKLLSGNYVAEAWAGDSVPASFDDRYFTGREEFTLTRGDNKAVEIVCHIANVAVKVAYEDNIDEVLSDYTFTVGHSQGSLDFVGRDDRTGYFMMNSRDKDLEWTLTGTLNNGETFTRRGKIENAKRATLYAVTVKCPAQNTEIGGAYVTIDIDESAIEINDTVEIIGAPVVRGIGYNIAETIRTEKGAVGRRAVWISANGTLEGVVLTSDYFKTLFGISGNDFDLLLMTDETLRQQIKDAGIEYTTEYHEAEDVTTLKLNFTSAFTDVLPDGEYSFRIDAKDSNGKTGTATLSIFISDAPVTTAACVRTDIWATRALVAGDINKSDAVSPVMKYRARGTVQWTDAATEVNGSRMTAVITGLQPSTEYEYTAACDGYESPLVKTFTTEDAAQLPNSGFESWTADGKLWKMYAEGESMFWDSGNPAIKQYQTFLSGNPPTYPDSNMKHSGNYSACLNSINMVVKFAAGNMFIGEFLHTAGTNGVLGWGRAWTSRPAKLRGYVKYSPTAVTDTSNDYPALSKGDTDNGIIYIALLDGTTEVDNDGDGGCTGRSFPVIVNTKTKKVFDKNAANVIAYGELVFKQATAGDGMIEFEIPLTYRRTDVIPSNIMCTASASIGGDYFVGGRGSKMWIDDLELVYE